MKTRFVYESRIPKLFNVAAITIYPFIFFEDKLPSRRLISHELVHIEQVQKYGWIQFYLSYFLFYFAFRLRGYDHWDAYLDIPYEVEARAKEDRGAI